MRAIRLGLLGILLLQFALLGTGCSCTPVGPGFAIHGEDNTGVDAPVTLTGWVNNGVEVTDYGDVQKRRKVEAGIEWSIAEGPANGATIDSSGKFVARKPGTYTVQAKMGQELATHKIEVAAEPDEDSAEASGTQYMEAPPEPADPATLEEIILSGNGMAVHNGGKPFTFTISKPRRVREIWSYHWNNEKGKLGGTITLKGASGETQYKVTRTAPGQGGVSNAYWIADVDFVIQPDTYTFIDSDPASWAQNAESGGKGMGWIKVVKE
jgi:hypothetical protein